VLCVCDLQAYSANGDLSGWRGIQGVQGRRRLSLPLLKGQKAGLGAAYIRGMLYAIHELMADAVFEMDADFSHKPSDVPRLVQALDDGADFVIGSRYVPGGSIPQEWGMFRKMNSRYGNKVSADAKAC
jgi:dolichol-phosphate mannosyltransferase